VLRYIEFCAGLGGTRLGLQRLGWRCEFACDSDSTAVAAHQKAFGDCTNLDVRDLSNAIIPPHEVLVAGFPCQPFSSSGNRLGFDHRRGNTFSYIQEFILKTGPRFIYFENVRGLLSNRGGHSMASILKALTDAGYYVEWCVVNSLSYKIPQDRQRLFLLATRVSTGARQDQFWWSSCSGSNKPRIGSVFFHPLLRSSCKPKGAAREGVLSKVIKETEPLIGRSLVGRAMPFAKYGQAFKDNFATCEVTHHSSPYYHMSLGEICCPGINGGDAVRSVRYWGHTGTTIPYSKTAPVSHCIGTNIGAGPTFCIPMSMITTTQLERKVLSFANWSRRQGELLIFRLTPERSLLLFDKAPAALIDGLAASGAGITKQYVLIGNMVAPSVAEVVGNCLSEVARLGESNLACQLYKNDRGDFKLQ